MLAREPLLPATATATTRAAKETGVQRAVHPVGVTPPGGGDGEWGRVGPPAGRSPSGHHPHPTSPPARPNRISRAPPHPPFRFHLPVATSASPSAPPAAISSRRSLRPLTLPPQLSTTLSPHHTTQRARSARWLPPSELFFSSSPLFHAPPVAPRFLAS